MMITQLHLLVKKPSQFCLGPLLKFAAVPLVTAFTISLTRIMIQGKGPAAQIIKQIFQNRELRLEYSIMTRGLWLERDSMYQMIMELFGESLLSTAVDLVQASLESIT
jgi:hypothetical protein